MTWRIPCYLTSMSRQILSYCGESIHAGPRTYRPQQAMRFWTTASTGARGRARESTLRFLMQKILLIHCARELEWGIWIIDDNDENDADDARLFVESESEDLRQRIVRSRTLYEKRMENMRERHKDHLQNVEKNHERTVNRVEEHFEKLKIEDMYEMGLNLESKHATEPFVHCGGDTLAPDMEPTLWVILCGLQTATQAMPRGVEDSELGSCRFQPDLVWLSPGHSTCENVRRPPSSSCLAWCCRPCREAERRWPAGPAHRRQPEVSSLQRQRYRHRAPPRRQLSRRPSLRGNTFVPVE
jgi:hypothetical protein